MDQLTLYVESLIFASQTPISFDEIKLTLEDCFEQTLETIDVQNAIESLISRYQSEHFAIEIIEISGGFTFMSKGAYHHVIGTYLKQSSNKKLSRAAMETLSIIAYKQPVNKAEMESIRGVNCDYTVQKLLEKELIEIVGRSEGIGKPLMYGTSQKFMDYFGLKSIEDMPSLQDFELPEYSIGLSDETTVNSEEE